jgi:hypothetical protein
LINNEQYSKDHVYENTVKDENTLSSSDKTKTLGLDNAVITVYPVTIPNITKVVDYNLPTSIPDNLYCLYERVVKWAYINCSDTEEKL